MSFNTAEKNGIEYLCSDLIETPHAFFKRKGGVSIGIYDSLNLSTSTGDSRENVYENYKLACSVFGVSQFSGAVTKQVHKNDVKIITREDIHIPLTDCPYSADGIVTKMKELPLFCFTADCVPVLLYDRKAKTAAAVHCGWRSTVADILSNALEKMVSLGASPKNVCAAIGPSIGKCHFECGPEVAEELSKLLGGDTDGLFDRKDNGKVFIDLKEANKRRLIQLGVGEECIDVCPVCTYCSHDEFFSHRYTKGLRGVCGNAIMIN